MPAAKKTKISADFVPLWGEADGGGAALPDGAVGAAENFIAVVFFGTVIHRRIGENAGQMINISVIMTGFSVFPDFRTENEGGSVCKLCETVRAVLVAGFFFVGIPPGVLGS